MDGHQRPCWTTGAKSWPSPLVGKNEGMISGDTKALAEGENGDLWVGFDGEGAARISMSGFLTYNNDDGLPSSQIRSMTLDRNGRLLVTTSERPGMNAYGLQNGHFVNQDLGLDSRYFPARWVPWHQLMLADRGGYWWTASSLGLLQFVPPRDGHKARLISMHTIRDATPDDQVAHVLEDSKGNVWFSTLPILRRVPERPEPNQVCDGKTTVFLGEVHAPPVTSIRPSGAAIPLPAIVDGVAVNAPAEFYWTPGSRHTVAFGSPLSPQGVGVQFLFSKWSDGMTSTSRTIIASNTQQTFTADFIKQFFVSTSAQPSNAGVITGQGWYTAGSSATFSATATPGYRFIGFNETRR